MAVIGVSQAAAFFQTYSLQVQEDVKTEIELTTYNIERKAIALAPSAGENLPLTSSSGRTQANNTNLASFIHGKILPDGYTGEVDVDAQAGNFAAYVEFGTGDSAAQYVPTLPSEWQQVARRYYINGKGRLIKKPFLLPAFFEYSAKLPEAIRKILFDAIR